MNCASLAAKVSLTRKARRAHHYVVDPNLCGTLVWISVVDANLGGSEAVLWQCVDFSRGDHRRRRPIEVRFIHTVRWVDFDVKLDAHPAVARKLHRARKDAGRGV